MTDRLEVTGSGQASATPDRVLLELRIQAEHDTVAACLRAVAEGVRAVVERTAGLRSADDPAPRTQGLHLHTRHDREGRRTLGYTASQQLRLTLPGTDVAGDVVAVLSEAAGDALGIDGLSLSVSDPADLQRRAREAAFADACNRAEQYAALAERELGPVRHVRDLTDHAGPSPRQARAVTFEAGSMPIEAGEHTVQASVQVTWELC